MKRRDFTAGTAAGLGLGLSSLAQGQTAATAPRQLIELRIYSFANAEKQAAFARFLGEAGVPALNRAGVNPVGIFQLDRDNNPKPEQVSLAETDLVVALPFDGIDTMLKLPAALDADEAYQEAGKDILQAPKGDPAYLRINTALLLSFDDCPRVEVPSLSENRVLQLRVYESRNADRALRKMEMFNQGGEIALFRKVGMTPVLFGQRFAGDRMPNLTYMLSFEDADKQKAGWEAFIQSPEWDALKNDPKYAETVSRITNDNLRPLPGSQI